MSLPEPPLAFVHHRTHRLIASRYPTIGVFDELVSAEDAAAAMEIELLTNGGSAPPAACQPRCWSMVPRVLP